jgi:glycosyltransferase involved in cell wall biosynthesis
MGALGQPASQVVITKQPFAAITASAIAPARKLSVLFVVPNLHVGGAERVVTTLVRNFDRQQFNVALVAIDGRNQAIADDLPANIDVLDLECTRVRYSAPALIRLIWMRRPDVIFSVLGHLNLLLALIKPLLPRSTKLVARETTVVSSNLTGNRYSAIWKLAYRLLLHRCDAVICQSQVMRDDLITAIGLSRENLSIVRNPLDIERIRRLSNEPVDVRYAPKSPRGIDNTIGRRG